MTNGSKIAFETPCGMPVGAAERIAQRMDGHGTRRGDRHAAVERSQQHILACLHVGAVFIGSAQILGDKLNPLETEHSCKRVGLAGNVGLNAVAERIDACGCGDGLGKAFRQLWVEQNAARQEVRMHDADLQLLFRNEDDGVRCRFRAGTGRCRRPPAAARRSLRSCSGRSDRHNSRGSSS